MLFVLKTTYLIMGQHLPRLGKYSIHLLTFANLFWLDSIHSPTLANLFWPDSIHSPTFANLFWLDSIHLPTFAKGLFGEKCDSPRHIRTSNLPNLGRVAIANSKHIFYETLLRQTCLERFKTRGLRNNMRLQLGCCCE
jgi:hypothetical protein